MRASYFAFFAYFALSLPGERMGRLLEIARAALPERVVWSSRAAEPKSGSADQVPVSDPRGAWPPESLEAERRLGHPHARLFPFIGRKVRTPEGPGTLLQVFADRATVLLDSEISRCSFFSPSQIELVSWELSE
jgi:hypothetical protein